RSRDRLRRSRRVRTWAVPSWVEVRGAYARFVQGWVHAPDSVLTDLEATGDCAEGAALRDAEFAGARTDARDAASLLPVAIRRSRERTNRAPRPRTSAR